MSSSWSCITLLLFASLRILQGAPSVSLNQTSSTNVLSGNAVCLNTMVELTCTATDVETFTWKINDLTVKSWYIPRTDPSTNFTHDSIKVYLNKINTNSNGEEPFTDVISRLVGTVEEDLHNGYKISCLGSTTTETVESLTLNYSIVMGHSPPKPVNFVADVHSMNSSSHSITFIWDLVFSTHHAIESYSIAPAATYNDSVLVSCPISCPFDSPCVCNVTGQLPVEGINVNISAINCDNQEGPTTTTTVLPKDCQTETLGNLSTNQTDSMCKHNNVGSIDITHGVACFNGTSPGSILLYQCDDGFTAAGNTSRLCLSDGTWTGEVPRCQSLNNHVYGWMIALVTVSLLIWIVSSVLIIVWSIMYHKLFLWSHVVWKVSIFAGVLVVAVTLQLAVIIVWGMFMDTVRTQSSPFVASRSSLVVTSIVLSILALSWMTAMCLASIMYSYYRSDPDEHIKIERENELYYLGRSLRSICPEEPSYSLRKESGQEAVDVDEDDIYDRISHNSDIMNQEILDDSFTDSEGYIKTTRQQLQGVMIMEGISEVNDESLSYCV